MASYCGSSYSTSLETTNYARACRIVVDILRDILFQLLAHEILPSDLPNKVQKNLSKLGRLDLEIKQWLFSISASSTNIPRAENFDVTSLYTLIRNLCSQVPSPSKQWGQFPQASEKSVGDDIERVREFRNKVYGHAKQAKIENTDFNKLCSDIKDVVSRFDAHFQSLSTPVKCDFESDIDIILTCSMDKLLEESYIEKMKQIAVLSDGYGDVKKTLETFQSEIKETFQSEIKALRKTVKKTLKRPGPKLHDQDNDMNMNVGDDKQVSTTRKTEDKDPVLEMPPVQELKILIIMGYVNLKLDLEMDVVIEIAKELFKKKKHKNTIEEIANVNIRRHCADQLLKRVLKLEEKGLKIFWDLLKKHCLEGAQKLAELKVSDKDSNGFKQVSESKEMVPQGKPNGLKLKQQDVEFFQCRLSDSPEKVDEIADKLLSRFHISIYDHSQIIKNNDPLKRLMDKIQSCHFDSDSGLKSVFGSKLYNTWESYKVDGSVQALETPSFWHRLLESMHRAGVFAFDQFRGLGIHFKRANRGSLVLEFETLDNFDVNLLTPEAVETKVKEMIKTVCPDYHGLLKEPIHLAIYLKPSSNTDRTEVYFYLETSEEKEECSCVKKLGRRDKQHIVEEINSATLSKWIFNRCQLNEDTRTQMVDLISSKGMSRKKKMKNLLTIVEHFENGYELLEKYCEEYNTFVYDKVFKKYGRMTGEDKVDAAQRNKLSSEKKEGLQRLSCTWINLDVGSIEEKMTQRYEKQHSGDSTLTMMTEDITHEARDQNGRTEQVRDQNGRMLDEILRNFTNQSKVKNVLLVGFPSAGKSSLINSLVSLILGKYIPVASVGEGIQLTHTYAAHRYDHLGINMEHLSGSPNEINARKMHPHIPNVCDFVGLGDANTKELKEILSLQIFGHLEPGVQITGLLKMQREHGVGSLRSWYTKSKEDWKIDVIIFVHSVATSEVPKELIQCLLDIIKPKDSIRPVDVEFYVVLTKMDKIGTGEVTERSVTAIENAVADLCGFRGFKEYKLVKITNWCDDVGFPDSSADYLDQRSVTLNNHLLKLLRNMSMPKAMSSPTHDITFHQKVWFYLYGCLTRVVQFDTFGTRDVFYAGVFGLLLVIVVLLLISK